MEDKILVRVRMPIADVSQDVRIPLNLTVSTVSEMLAQMFIQSCQRPLPMCERPTLWLSSAENPLDEAMTIRELGIADSDELFLI